MGRYIVCRIRVFASRKEVPEMKEEPYQDTVPDGWYSPFRAA